MKLDFIKSSKILFTLALCYRNFAVKITSNIKSKKKLNPKQMEILKTLKSDGIVVVPGYFSSDECKTMKSEYDTLLLNHSFECPKENERRVFGMDQLSVEVKRIFSDDTLSWEVCEYYLNEKMKLQTTMSARIDYGSGVRYGSGGSWHRDSFSRQIKSISYLTDMTDDNGPFMYIKGSHKMANILKLIWSDSKNIPPGETRYTDSYIDKAQKILGKDISYFNCNAGDLILADIRGLHTTSKVKKGYAYSIFNYYIAFKDHKENGSIMKVVRDCISQPIKSIAIKNITQSVDRKGNFRDNTVIRRLFSGS
jgi:hypothetical protein